MTRGREDRASRPLSKVNAVTYLHTRYGLDAADATDLINRAAASVSGMAPHPRDGKSTIWAIAMTTQPGKFMFDEEDP